MKIYSKLISNWIFGEEISSSSDNWIDKFDPHTGNLLYGVTSSTIDDVQHAVGVAKDVFGSWKEHTPIRRGQILSDIVGAMKINFDELTECIALETGKPPQDARAEVGGAILQAEYWAGEGMRLYGRSLTSGTPGKYSHTIRQPRGVAGLIVPANTPLANIAWKTFPALICGNTVVLKAAEDSPLIAILFAKIAKKAGLPDGVFNVIQGRGLPAGMALVEDPRVDVVSFTGSTSVGRRISEVCGSRLARVSLELGGKNPFVVCDDADLDNAIHWASLSAFSNAGQRCAAGSRILIFKNIYDEFRERLVSKAITLKLGTSEGCDLGPVINHRQKDIIVEAIKHAKTEGANVLCGDGPPNDPLLASGYYINPTVIDSLPITAELSSKEIFGPVVTLHPVSNIYEALEVANSSEYGLTAAIHTCNVDRAMWFAQRIKAGVANINLGTFGSEPHMPFGGYGASGNGTREPGIEALDVYSELKNISFLTRNHLI
jgi:acyl-CoA reductase-like NAD-dependent aldehyde dehydrogenase